MDPGTRRVTQLFSIVFFVLAYACLFAYRQLEQVGAMLALITIVIIYAVVVGLSIHRYRINETNVEICSYVYKIKLPLENIEAARVMDTTNLLLLKGMGMSGLFGQSGLYFSRELGPVFIYGRKWGGEQVLIRTKENKLYLLSPDDPEGFAARLENSL